MSLHGIPSTHWSKEITQKEWNEAIRFFAQNPSEVKMRRKEQRVPKKYSFIQVDGETYAIAREYLGEGGFSKVKEAIRSDGVLCKVNISPGDIPELAHNEEQAGKLTGEFIGKTNANFAHPKEFWKHLVGTVYERPPYRTYQKTYKIMKLHHGEQLYKVLVSRSFSMLEKLVIAIQCAKIVQELHRLRIIHADIKPENFIINPENLDISIIDYGISKLLPDDKSYVDAERCGTPGYWDSGVYHPGYMAPEIDSKCFSFASDVYALGQMFNQDLGINLPSMITRNVHDRSSIAKVIDDLTMLIARCPDYNENIRHIVERDFHFHDVVSIVPNATTAASAASSSYAASSEPVRQPAPFARPLPIPRDPKVARPLPPKPAAVKASPVAKDPAKQESSAFDFAALRAKFLPESAAKQLPRELPPVKQPVEQVEKSVPKPQAAPNRLPPARPAPKPPAPKPPAQVARALPKPPAQVARDLPKPPVAQVARDLPKPPAQVARDLPKPPVAQVARDLPKPPVAQVARDLPKPPAVHASPVAKDPAKQESPASKFAALRARFLDESAAKQPSDLPPAKLPKAPALPAEQVENSVPVPLPRPQAAPGRLPPARPAPKPLPRDQVEHEPEAGKRAAAPAPLMQFMHQQLGGMFAKLPSPVAAPSALPRAGIRAR